MKTCFAVINLRTNMAKPANINLLFLKSLLAEIASFVIDETNSCCKFPVW